MASALAAATAENGGKRDRSVDFASVEIAVYERDGTPQLPHPGRKLQRQWTFATMYDSSPATPHGRAWLALLFRRCIHDLQRYSIPLVAGILVALVWANVHPDSYEYFVGTDYRLPHWAPLGQNMYLAGHKVTLHFIVNDIFMVFFFGIAAKEVTEACLPGGSLNPIR